MTEREVEDMSPSESDATSAERLIEIAVSKDELEMLQLLRSMKRGTRLEAGESIRASSSFGRPAQAVATFDGAIVIAHHAQADHLQLGFVRLAAEEAQCVKLIPISSPKEYGIIEKLWDQLTGEEAAVKEKSSRKGFLRYAAEQLESAEAVHRRAREVIESHRETRRKAEEVSRRTAELLSYN
jgi:hypothetical protein